MVCLTSPPSKLDVYDVGDRRVKRAHVSEIVIFPNIILFYENYRSIRCRCLTNVEHGKSAFRITDFITLILEKTDLLSKLKRRAFYPCDVKGFCRIF